MRLNLYDEHMQRIAVIGDRYLSVLWSEGYNTVEPFAMEVLDTEENRRKIRPECFVGRDDRKTVMVIKTVKIEGGKIMAAGKQAARCLDDVPFVGTIEKGCEVAGAIREAFEKAGGYQSFRFSERATGVLYEHQISNKSILKLMETMCQNTDVGFETVRGGGIVTVEFYKPEGNENLKFSEAFGNLTVNSLLMSTENLKNHAIVLGAGEGKDRTRVDVDHSNGGRRLSMIVDARDISREETDTDDSYREKLTARGEEKLLEKTKTWECIFAPLAEDFGIRYDLGDILTVVLREYGIKLKARVARFTQKGQNNQVSTTIEVGAITIVR